MTQAPLSSRIRKKNPEKDAKLPVEENVVYSMPIGFGVVSPTGNTGFVGRSVGAIRTHYPNCHVVCSTTPEQTQYIKSDCEVVTGKDTITNLINSLFAAKGFAEGWIVIMMEGCLIRPNLDKKYARWAKSHLDVLFPLIAERNRSGKFTAIHGDFHDATLNGLAIHTQAFRELGKFGNGPLDVVRREWWLQAITKGYQFKAILNCPIDR